MPSMAVKRIEGEGKQKSRKPAELHNLFASDADKTLILQGTDEAVAKLKAQFVQQGENVIYLLKTAPKAL